MLSLVLVGVAARAFVPWFIEDDLVCVACAGPGSASDDDNNPVPGTDSTTCKFVRACTNCAKAFLVRIDMAPSQLLMPVHALAVSDVATEPLLPDHFLPNAETGPPDGIALTGCPARSLPVRSRHSQLYSRPGIQQRRLFGWRP
jgi:hypothetical protein